MEPVAPNAASYGPTQELTRVIVTRRTPTRPKEEGLEEDLEEEETEETASGITGSWRVKHPIAVAKR